PGVGHAAGGVRLDASRSDYGAARPGRTGVHARPLGHAVRRATVRRVLHSPVGALAWHGRARRRGLRHAPQAGDGAHARAGDLPAGGSAGGTDRRRRARYARGRGVALRQGAEDDGRDRAPDEALGLVLFTLDVFEELLGFLL